MKRRQADSRLNLSSNELIHPDVDQVLRAVAAALRPDLFRRYPVTKDVIAALARYVGCAPHELIVTPGSDAALRLVCGYFARVTSGAGTVILQDPNYVAWEQTTQLFGLTLRRVPMRLADPAAQAAQLLAEAHASRGCLIAVSVPNGPVGGCLPEAVLDELTEVARTRGHLLVIDSCYQVFSGSLRATLDRGRGPVLVVQSLSKSHGLAGARVAVLRGDSGLLARVAGQPLEHAVAAPSLLAARIATEHHSRFERIWGEIGQVREHTADRLRLWGFPSIATGGNFLTVPLGSAEAAGQTAAALSASGYRVRDLSALPGLTGCLRFTVADHPTTERFLVALQAALPTTALSEVS